MRPRATGFTLIESLVVIALISILLMLAVPSFTSFIRNYRTTAAVNDFLQGVVVTRNEAIKRGRRVVMVPNDPGTGQPTPSGSWRNGWSIFVDNSSPTNFLLDSTDELIFQHNKLASSTSMVNAVTGSGEAFTDVNARTYVSFDGTGYPRDLTGGIQRGGVKVTDSTGGAAPKPRWLCLARMGRPVIVSDPSGDTTCTNT